MGMVRGHPAAPFERPHPAPDNFTIPALAGGDNHIRLPWQEALNSAPVPLRVWHPADSPEHAADVTMRRFVFSFFFTPHRSSFFFFFNPLLSFFIAASEMYLGPISMSRVKKILNWQNRVLPPLPCEKCYCVSSFCWSWTIQYLAFVSQSWGTLWKSFHGLLLFSGIFGFSIDYILQLLPSKWSNTVSDLKHSKKLRTYTLCGHGSILQPMLGGVQNKRDAIALRSPRPLPNPSWSIFAGSYG